LHRVVIMRHGESRYNVLNRYAGWLDCDLTPEGVAQARRAGQVLREREYSFDLAHTSMLKRAVETLGYALAEMGMNDIPVRRSWQLNERHFGALDDLTRAEAEARFGQETLRQCREDFRFPPPGSTLKDTAYSGELPPGGVMPASESMHDATMRCLAYWQDVILPEVSTGKRALVVAHGDILRLLTGCLLGKTEDEIIHASVLPNATPMVFELGEDLRVIGHIPLNEVRDTLQTERP